MIIDVHCHIGSGGGYELAPQDLLKQMDENSVDKAIVVPTKKYIAVYNREGNDYCLEQAKKYPGRLYAMATANPWFGERAVDEVKRAFDAGAVGLKLHPFLQGFRITDAVVDPLMEVAAEFDRPVYFHTGTPVSSMPFQLTELAMRFPKANLIMGHMAFSDFWYDVTKATKAVDNIYLDTSMQWPAFITNQIKAVGAEKIMFGSDLPNNELSLEIEKITRYVTDEQPSDSIFFKTAQKIFKEIG